MKATDNSTGNNIINTSIKFINMSNILDIKLLFIIGIVFIIHNYN
jgi:hypothetical protein